MSRQYGNPTWNERRRNRNRDADEPSKENHTVVECSKADVANLENKPVSALLEIERLWRSIEAVEGKYRRRLKKIIFSERKRIQIVPDQPRLLSITKLVLSDISLKPADESNGYDDQHDDNF